MVCTSDCHYTDLLRPRPLCCDCLACCSRWRRCTPDSSSRLLESVLACSQLSHLSVNYNGWQVEENVEVGAVVTQLSPAVASLPPLRLLTSLWLRGLTLSDGDDCSPHQLPGSDERSCRGPLLPYPSAAAHRRPCSGH
jgi:hypothetical protein